MSALNASMQPEQMMAARIKELEADLDRAHACWATEVEQIRSLWAATSAELEQKKLQCDQLRYTLAGEIEASRMIIERADQYVCAVVKPLEWVKLGINKYFEARVIGILYSVRLGSDGTAHWQAGHMGHWREANSVDAAKSAAQADYERRILSALTIRPEADVRNEGVLLGWKSAIEAAEKKSNEAWKHGYDATPHIRAIPMPTDVAAVLFRMNKLARVHGMRAAAEIAAHRYAVCEDAFSKGLGPEERHCALEAKHIEEKILARAEEIEKEAGR